MEQNDLIKKEILEEQIKWSKVQALVLEHMERLLYEMKEIVEFTLQNKLSVVELERFNRVLNALQIRFSILEQQLYPFYH